MPGLVAVLFSAAILIPMSASPAVAGEFTVRQCVGSSFQGFFGQLVQIGNDRIDAVNGCSTSGSGKVGIYQDRQGARFANYEGGQFAWTAPKGVEVFGTVFTSRLRDANGIRARLIGPSAYFTDIDLDEGLPHDGLQRTTRWTNRSQPRNLIVARLQCSQENGCANAGSDPKAYFEVSDAEFKSRDVARPAVMATGFLWVWSNDWEWHRGNVAYRIDASDTGTGIASAFLLVNGLRVDLGAVTCTGDRSTYALSFSPCPGSVVRTAVADTSQAPFQEGANVVEFCTADYAASPDEANRTCTARRVIFIDNVAPGAPVDLHPEGGTDWRPENGFKVGWRNPGDSGAEIVEADYRVIRNAGNSPVGSGSVPLGASPSLPLINLPGPGEYRVEVQLRDSAGNLGSPSSTTLRFDDAPPGNVVPEPPTGWISADELPFEQEIERAEPGGPSGVGGYAFAVSRSGPVPLCPTGVCQPLELSLNQGADARNTTLNDLAEGRHWVSAVAASGARVASKLVGTTVLKVDKTDPATDLRGLPDGWVNHPVTLTVKAGDGGSGMAKKAGDEGAPVTVIHAAGSAPYVAPGDSAAFTVADEGPTRVEYWARDLAGNADDGVLTGGGERHAAPAVATVRIDRRPPVIKFSAGRIGSDPELIRAAVRDSDSGLDFGTISYRPAGRDEKFTDLETNTDGNTLSARLPSDDLPKGRYQLRAKAFDRAGNATDTDQTGSGPILELPVKRPVALTAAFVKGKRSVRRTVGPYGDSVQVEGRVLRAGKGLAGASLVVVERFAKGSRRDLKFRGIRTDGTGRYSLVLRPGPSRSVEIRYPGSRINQRTSSRQLYLAVRDRIGLRIEPRVLRNRGRVRMTGSVLSKGALRPARGKLVAIQYFDPARARWRPVEVLRADRRGRFRFSYRFRTIAVAQRIIFRAVSLPEAGWPFSSSTSRRRSVIVYPSR